MYARYSICCFSTRSCDVDRYGIVNWQTSNVLLMQMALQQTVRVECRWFVIATNKPILKLIAHNITYTVYVHDVQTVDNTIHCFLCHNHNHRCWKLYYIYLSAAPSATEQNNFLSPWTRKAYRDQTTVTRQSRAAQHIPIFPSTFSIWSTFHTWCWANHFSFRLSFIVRFTLCNSVERARQCI